MGACASREGRSPEARGILVHWEAPSQVGLRGSCVILENWAKQGLRGQKTEKVALFSILTAHGLWPLPDVDSGNREWGGIQTSLVHAALMAPRVSSCSPVMQHTNLTSAHNPCGTEGGPRYPRVAWHTNPASSHKTYGANSGPGC